MKYEIIADTNYKKEQRFKEILLFFIFSEIVPRPTWGHYWGDCVAHPMLITAFIQVWVPKPGGVSSRFETGTTGPLSPS